jgi:hypothetical protein
MSRPDPLVAAQVNWAQYEPGQTRGHYESFYLRANHPSEPLAFWLRYTIFAPNGRPEDAEGELWAVVFHGSKIVSERRAVPMTECVFDRTGFDVRVAGATLDATSLMGQAGEIAWDLTYSGDQPPLYLLPPRFYKGGFPKAKSLVPLPLARFTGSLTAAGRIFSIDGWTGSQNHNWGSRHTDRYAFGQVAGFDGEPDSFLEVATVRTKVGPFWIPQLTPLVLRHRGHEYALTSLGTSRRAAATVSATVSGTSWMFASSSSDVAVEGEIRAPAGAFVVLEYRNPPGGIKYCHNTKIAQCSLAFTDKRTGVRTSLGSAHGALFEILTDSEREASWLNGPPGVGTGSGK